MKFVHIKTYGIYSVLSLGFLLPCVNAQAQMNSEPWGFSQQNRASIAALMRQVEDVPVGAEGASGVNADSMICGGGEASASGNSTCIILKNAMGDISIGQDSNGNQTAKNRNEEIINETPSDIDDVLAALTGSN